MHMYDSIDTRIPSTEILSSIEDVMGTHLVSLTEETDSSKITAVHSPMEAYRSYLKSKYLELTMPDYGKWPHLPSRKYVNLTIIEKEWLSPMEVEQNVKALTSGNVDKIRHRGGITFADIATPNRKGVLPKFVLVEGAPGVGKSTFAWKACRKWAKGKIFKEYDLVILIRLRDEYVRKARCLGDLIQYPCDQTVQQKVVEEIIKTGGNRVLLLLEGYDELPASLQQEGSLLRDVTKGYKLNQATVIITSQHWASQPFLLPHHLSQRPLSQHLEILGFARKDIDDYLLVTLKVEPSILHEMRRYLSLFPHIHNTMYIPLNCAIVTQVYRCSKRMKSQIPTTMTELYSSLIRSLLLRHICSLPEYTDKCPELESLRMIPPCIKEDFMKLAQLACKGNRNQQYIFAENEIPSGLNTLGLMQSTMELYVDRGARKSFNFLHLTIQDFLTAYYLSTFSLSIQVELIVTGQSYQQEATLFRFLAGLSPLALQNTLLVSKAEELKLESEDIYRLFEAKLQLSMKCVTVDSSNETNPFYYYILSLVIARSSCKWHINIKGEKETIRMFVSGILSGTFESEVTLSISCHALEITEVFKIAPNAHKKEFDETKLANFSSKFDAVYKRHISEYNFGFYLLFRELFKDGSLKVEGKH